MPITICVTSDVHGRLDRFAEITQKIKELQPDLIIDNGDFLQGSLTSYYYEYIKPSEHPMIALANEIGYDVAIFGNHEFNYPPARVEQMRTACHFPWIAGNIGDFAKPYFIKDIHGQRVAVVGVTTHYTPIWDEHHYTAHLTFSDAYEAATYWVDYVKTQERVQKIILCYHGGFTKNPTTGFLFASDTGENQANRMLTIPHVDALITGHQHLEIATMINGKPVLQPGANGRCVGCIELGETPAVALHYTTDLPEHYPLEVSTWLDETIGFTHIDFTYEGLLLSRIKKQPFIDFMHDVQLQATGAQISAVELFYHETGGFTGTITHKDVLQNMCRPNTLKVLALTGADIRAALEQCAAIFALHANGDIDFSYNVHTDTPQPYLYDFWGGIDYTFTLSNAVGQRVTKLHYNGKPIEEQTVYHVVMNSYRATGAEFTMFKNNKVITESVKIIPELLFDYIKRHSPLQHIPHGEFKVLK